MRAYKGIRLFLFVIPLLWPNFSHPLGHARWENYSDFKKLIVHLKLLAPSGDKLQYFSFSEGFDLEKIANNKCHKVQSLDVVKDFNNAINLIWRSTGGNHKSFDSLRQSGIKDFRRLVGKDLYWFCQKTISDPTAVTIINQYRSDRYRFQIELGWNN